MDEIYKDLDLGSSVDKKDVTVYEDGDELKDKAVAITKNDDDTEFGANGVLTEVFYDDDDDTIVITMVNTYVGTINRSVAAKGNKDAYVEIAPEDVKPDGVNGIQDFDTVEEFEDDAYVLYTYSQSAEEVKSVALAELVSGTVTRAENNAKDEDERKALTIGGTRYTASKNIAGEDIGNVSVDEDYDVYLDAYGYLIYVEEVDEIGDYALLMNTQDKGDFSNNRALLVFADGTEKVVDTTENYKSGDDAIKNGTIVTYRVDEDGDYTLKAVKKTLVSKADTDNKVADSAYTDGVNDFSMSNDKATIALNGTDTITSNSSTVFVVYNDTSDDYTVYTGIKNAPSIDAKNGKVEAYAYCKSGKMATVMFIFVQDGSDIEDDSNTTLFLAKESVSNLIHDKDGDYFEYQAIVNGEVKTVKVDQDLDKTLNGMYKNYSVDKYGIITKVSTNGANGYTAFSDGEGDSGKEYLTGAGIDKISADYTVLLDTVNHKDNANYTITVADDAKIFYVDEDGNIEASSYRAIAKDSNDKVYAVVDEYLVEYLVIEEVDDKSSNEDKPELSKDIEVRDVTLGSTTTILQDEGCTDISVENVGGTAKWTYTKPNGGTVKNAEVTAKQVYVVNLKLDADVQALVDAGTINVKIADGSEYVAAKGEVKIVLTHNTSTFGSTFNANSTDSSKTPVTASGTGDATGNKTQTITISDVGAITTDITVTVSK